MGMEIPNFEENAKEMLTPQEASMSEARSEMLEKVKSESGLDDATFEEIVNTFDSETMEPKYGYIQFKFKVKGHEVSGSLDDKNRLPNERMILRVDGGDRVLGEKFTALYNKYHRTILGLAFVTKDTTQNQAQESARRKAVDDLL
jgi:hypothetical protein